MGYGIWDMGYGTTSAFRISNLKSQITHPTSKSHFPPQQEQSGPQLQLLPQQQLHSGFAICDFLLTDEVRIARRRGVLEKSHQHLQAIRRNANKNFASLSFCFNQSRFAQSVQVMSQRARRTCDLRPHFAEATAAPAIGAALTSLGCVTARVAATPDTLKHGQPRWVRKRLKGLQSFIHNSLYFDGHQIVVWTSNDQVILLGRGCAACCRTSESFRPRGGSRC